MEPFMQLFREFGPGALGGGGLLGVFMYINKYSREMRDENRADNAALRAERAELWERLSKLETRLTEQQSSHDEQQRRYEARIRELEHEIAKLRGGIYD